MPKNPPDLARLLHSPSPTDRVQVQQTDLGYDLLARYICNDWSEIEAQQQDGGYPFDVVVIGAGMFGGYIAEKRARRCGRPPQRGRLCTAWAHVLPGQA